MELVAPAKPSRPSKNSARRGAAQPEPEPFISRIMGMLSACVSSDPAMQQGPLTDVELADRVEEADAVYQWPFGSSGVTLRFAWVSMRGYYPGEPEKTNQDAYKVVPSFGGDDKMLMGVFDGHGDAGTECACFVRDHLEAEGL